MIAGFLIVAGAFLAFVVQPMAAKALLPAFGGAAAVWTAALLFFQVALLGGYLYARHATRPIHLVALALTAGLVSTPLPRPHALPVWGVLSTLAGSIGLAFLVLTAASPQWQRWRGGTLPYRYYALSNAASLLALILYPLAIEPYLDIDAQFRFWRLAVFAFLAASALAILRTPVPPGDQHKARVDPVWVAAAATGTLLLGATTNQLIQEVAPVPFLWVLPLAIYLLSFILTFDRPNWYRPTILAVAAGVLAPAAALLAVVGLRVDLTIHFVVYLPALLVCLWICHGEVYRRRPDHKHLGTFYVAIAAGGALGGMLVSVVAPFVFTSYAEFPLALAAAAALGLYACWHEGLSAATRVRRSALAMALFTPIATVIPNSGAATTLAGTRNFYGVLRVTEAGGLRKLSHGATTHGRQFTDPARASQPTSYYGPSSGAGLAIRNHPARGVRPMRVGIVGLGAATLAAYSQRGDRYTFYELNPAVAELARSHFTFLRNAQGTVDVKLGDGRLLLAAEQPQNFDLLLLDAFSSDAIPVHLLTAEAAKVYQRHMAPEGTIAIHISNVTLDLDPVARGLASCIGWQATSMDSAGDPANAIDAAQWMLLVRSNRAPTSRQWPVRWTDRHAALWPLWKFSLLPH